MYVYILTYSKMARMTRHRQLHKHRFYFILFLSGTRVAPRGVSEVTSCFSFTDWQCQNYFNKVGKYYTSNKWKCFELKLLMKLAFGGTQSSNCTVQKYFWRVVLILQVYKRRKDQLEIEDLLQKTCCSWSW